MVQFDYHLRSGDHLRSTSGIICGSGLFVVQFDYHLWSGDHLRCCAAPAYPYFTVSRQVTKRNYPPYYRVGWCIVGAGHKQSRWRLDDTDSGVSLF